MYRSLKEVTLSETPLFTTAEGKDFLKVDTTADDTLIDNLIAKTKKGIGVIPIVPIKDSIRKVEGENSRHIDRIHLHKVQTPQCFLGSDIKNAYNQCFSKNFTDDASVFENDGGKIKTALGEEKNIKITTEEDLKIASVLFV